ncbi:MAG TPA: S-methyl-5-thioribose-1-phosphate isomerase [Candidatus Cloacimonadota bacterium]|nr:S-methyl-5-thioribose-1-phosphate isomerase [Candidatus Cloacimonadota bacterium]HPT71269.1 S-methyl-5-thioribose-1-phosphate isomerase [Candidatus Cloacimonadota bacterium]
MDQFMNIIRPIQLFEDTVLILDQTLLPGEERWLEIHDYRNMIEAIKSLRVRGAPLLGLAAITAIYLAAIEFTNDDNFAGRLAKAIQEVEASRPTAVNLFKATARVKAILNSSANSEDVINQLRNLYLSIHRFEEAACDSMGQNGASLFQSSGKLNIMTICNTGSLATIGIGTALGVIRTLAQSHDVHVYATETRPLLQGARLTMWELQKSGIPATLITDNMAGWVMKTKGIDAILTGADRITVSGDTANKIGTLNLAILAHHYHIPFYVVAPETTIDTSISSGDEIRIEERKPGEITFICKQSIAPEGCDVFNPAFDVTPHSLISGIITDRGVYKPPCKFE